MRNTRKSPKIPENGSQMAWNGPKLTNVLETARVGASWAESKATTGKFDPDLGGVGMGPRIGRGVHCRFPREMSAYLTLPYLTFNLSLTYL